MIGKLSMHSRDHQTWSIRLGLSAICISSLMIILSQHLIFHYCKSCWRHFSNYTEEVFEQSENGERKVFQKYYHTQYMENKFLHTGSPRNSELTNAGHVMNTNQEEAEMMVVENKKSFQETLDRWIMRLSNPLNDINAIGIK